ncbi:MAG: glycosyltransferase family 4 protein [Candidatus Omnitrophica bacterium]|nr:glycosyltransferase family 4 protein [Candidatus Omnitrophota bacterium]
MRFVFLHQYFAPEAAGSAVRLTELAFGLARAGVSIDVYTGLPSYEGKQAAPKAETHGLLTIYRLGKTRFNRKKSYGRILNGLTFFLSALWKLIHTSKDAFLFIGSDPPFLPFLGYLMKRWRNQRYVLHVADLYPEIAVALGIFKPRGFPHRLLNLTNRLSFYHAEAIVTLGEAMREKICSYLPEDMHAKVTVIENWEDGERIRPLNKPDNWFVTKHDLFEKTVVLYSGNLGLAHNLESLIEAAFLLRDEKKIQFLLIGEGAKKASLVAYAKRHTLPNILFLPYQPADHLPYSLTAGDIAVVSMQKGSEGLFVPGKLYTALACGQAILGMSPPNTEIADLIERENCGIVVAPDAPAEIAKVILKLHQHDTLLWHFQKNAREAFEKSFTKERAIRQYEKLFSSVTRREHESAFSLING